MNSNSNKFGRGYGFAYLTILFKTINAYNNCEIIENSSYFASKRAFNLLSDIQKAVFLKSATSIMKTLLELEPQIIEKDENVIIFKTSNRFRRLT